MPVETWFALRACHLINTRIVCCRHYFISDFDYRAMIRLYFSQLQRQCSFVYRYENVSAFAFIVTKFYLAHVL